MVLLLIAVFLLVLIFAILPQFLPSISRKVVDLAVHETDDELLLRADLKKFQDELSNISMIDEFAKYAKKERQINKAKDKLKAITKSKSEVFLKFKLGFNVVFSIGQWLVFITLMYFFRYEPLITWDAEWWWPMSAFVSFPTGVTGAVGIPCWIVICKGFIRQSLKLVSG